MMKSRKWKYRMFVLRYHIDRLIFVNRIPQIKEVLNIALEVLALVFLLGAVFFLPSFFH